MDKKIWTSTCIEGHQKSNFCFRSLCSGWTIHRLFSAITDVWNLSQFSILIWHLSNQCRYKRTLCPPSVVFLCKLIHLLYPWQIENTLKLTSWTCLGMLITPFSVSEFSSFWISWVSLSPHFMVRVYWHPSQTPSVMLHPIGWLSYNFSLAGTQIVGPDWSRITSFTFA